jgi:hypothetical protein
MTAISCLAAAGSTSCGAGPWPAAGFQPASRPLVMQFDADGGWPERPPQAESLPHKAAERQPKRVRVASKIFAGKDYKACHR